MNDVKLTLVESCQLEYIKPSSLTKHKTVNIELLTGGGKGLLHILNINERNREKAILENIDTENIGAATIIKLGQKNLIAKKAPRQCLLIFWKTSEAEPWNHVIIVDKEKPAPFNCVQQLKSKLVEICFVGTHTLTNPADDSIHELQFTKSHIAVLPADNTVQCESTSLSDILISTGCDFIFRKIHCDITRILETSGSPPVTRPCLRFRTLADSEAVKKDLILMSSEGKVANIVAFWQSQPVRHGSDPLPPLPTNSTAPSITSNGPCGKEPGLLEAPFWIKSPESVSSRAASTSSIYGNLPGFQNEIRSHEDHVRQVCQRESKNRFKNFVKKVNIKPAMMTLVERARKTSERLYDIPQVQATVPESEIKPFEFPQDNVESTFASFLKKLLRYTFNPELEKCPIGLSRSERDKFCWRLDLIEIDIVKGPAWKEFATRVMQLDSDDLEMIEEFSCKYKCQVVEVVLDHWHKLYSMKSRKCLEPALRKTIINTLNKMEKVALLQELHWDQEVDS